MKNVNCLLLSGFILLTAGCSSVKETGNALADSNGVLLDSETTLIGPKTYRLVVRGSSILFDGRAEQFFYRRADEFMQSRGCKTWALKEYRSGTENTLLGARRYAVGVIECTAGSAAQ